MTNNQAKERHLVVQYLRDLGKQAADDPGSRECAAYTYPQVQKMLVDVLNTIADEIVAGQHTK